MKNGYSDIYTTSFSSVPALPPRISPWQARLSEEEKDSINGEVSEEEIKAALWSLKAFKASGPDGLHAGFFQKFLLIGEFRIILILHILHSFLRFKARRRSAATDPLACVTRCIKLCRRLLLPG